MDSFASVGMRVNYLPTSISHRESCEHFGNSEPFSGAHWEDILVKTLNSRLYISTESSTPVIRQRRRAPRLVTLAQYAALPSRWMTR